MSLKPQVSIIMGSTSDLPVMEKAAKISHAMMIATPNEKVMGFSLAATAPNAYDATVKISELAQSGLKLTGKKKEAPRILPSIGSPLALRESHRLIRSQPNYTIKRPQTLVLPYLRLVDLWPNCVIKRYFLIRSTIFGSHF